MLKNIIFILLSCAVLAISSAAMAADEPATAAVKAETEPASIPDNHSGNPQTTSTRPVDDNHVDYRYCLELKTNQEISECRYKKK